MTESVQPMGASLGITHESYSLAHAIMKTRAAQASRLMMASFPVYRKVGVAVRGTVGAVFDDFALQSACPAAEL